MTMKKIILFAACLLLMTSNSPGLNASSPDGNHDESTVNVISSPSLLKMVKEWASGYSMKNSGIIVNVSAAGPGGIKWSDTNASIFFVSNEDIEKAGEDILWKMSVGRDIFVPVVSSGNPFANELLKTGLSPIELSTVFSASERQIWGSLLGITQKSPAQGYIVNDTYTISHLASFLKTDAEKINGITLESSQELIKALENDPYGIGFCRLTDLIDMEKQELAHGVLFLPVDINNNNQLDYFEQIYSDLNSFMHGVWIGKYPKELYSNIFTASSVYPPDEPGLLFIKWILTDGQNSLAENGYATLESGEVLSKTAAIADLNSITLPGSGNGIRFGSILWILIIITAVSVIAWLIYRFTMLTVSESPAFESIHRTVFSDKSLILPKGIFIDRSHTWAFMEKDGFVRVGIDDFLQHVTGNITRIIMKNTGEKVRKGETLFTLSQNGKQLLIYSPVSGIITERNESLVSDPSIVNTSPYNEGWVYKVEPEDWLKETRLLMMGENGLTWIKNEISRLKDFLATLLNTHGEQYTRVVLQDGGEIREYLLEEMGPEAWEEFQTNFIDKGR